ncbi:MAG: hypothetical protein SOW84_06045 [Candidatus Faecousia sp.]|nr:hypothetical protein [Candidatus Faecousia sp.]
MDLTLSQRLDKLLDAYSHAYDIDREITVEDTVYPAMATYYLRDENYLISKQHVLSAVEQHEYLYFYLTDHLTAEELQSHIDRTRQAGLALVHPHREHMFSNVGLVVLANTIDPEARRLIRHTHFRKNYRLTLYGWTEYQLAAMEVSTNSFFSNPAGKEARRNLESNFAPRETKKGVKKKT